MSKRYPEGVWGSIKIVLSSLSDELAHTGRRVVESVRGEAVVTKYKDKNGRIIFIDGPGLGMISNKAAEKSGLMPATRGVAKRENRIWTAEWDDGSNTTWEG